MIEQVTFYDVQCDECGERARVEVRGLHYQLPVPPNWTRELVFKRTAHETLYDLCPDCVLTQAKGCG